MKKKLDAMTVISIVLIVINLVLFWAATVNRGSCGPEFVNGASLLNLGQLFGGIVYAIPPTIQTANTLNGGPYTRNDIWLVTNNKLFLVFNINSISNNKTH